MTVSTEKYLKYCFYAMGVVWAFFVGTGCSADKKERALFTALNADKTGLTFANNLKASQDFNLFKYMYFYNGAGVGAGDFNNDGLTDLFFSSNQEKNRMYLNKGGLQFEDITEKAGIPS